VDNTRKQKLFRFLGLMLAAGAILQLERPLSRILQNEQISHVVIAVAAFASIPILHRIWPVGEEKPPSLGKWAIFLAVLLVGLTALDLPSSWKHDHQRLDYVLVRWLLPIGVILLCLAVRLRGPKNTS
jgi:hypothetical protein